MHFFGTYADEFVLSEQSLPCDGQGETTVKDAKDGTENDIQHKIIAAKDLSESKVLHHADKFVPWLSTVSTATSRYFFNAQE